MGRKILTSTIAFTILASGAAAALIPPTSSAANGPGIREAGISEAGAGQQPTSLQFLRHVPQYLVQGVYSWCERGTAGSDFSHAQP